LGRGSNLGANMSEERNGRTYVADKLIKVKTVIDKYGNIISEQIEDPNKEKESEEA
jgi:hypothetical protein